MIVNAPMYVLSFLGEGCGFANHFAMQDDLSKTIPYFPFPATSNPAVTQEIVITAGPNKTGSFLFYMNGVSFRGNYE